MANAPTPPERPRYEPEIIPPDRTTHRGEDEPAWPHYGPAWAAGRQRVFAARIGPFGVIVLALVLAAVLGLLIFALLGAVLIWLPVLAIAMLAGAFYRRLR